MQGIMRLYFDVLSKVSLIFLYFINNFFLLHKRKEIEESYLNKTFMKF